MMLRSSLNEAPLVLQRRRQLAGGMWVKGGSVKCWTVDAYVHIHTHILRAIPTAHAVSHLVPVQGGFLCTETLHRLRKAVCLIL